MEVNLTLWRTDGAIQNTLLLKHRFETWSAVELWPRYLQWKQSFFFFFEAQYCFATIKCHTVHLNHCSTHAHIVPKLEWLSPVGDGKTLVISFGFKWIPLEKKKKKKKKIHTKARLWKAWPLPIKSLLYQIFSCSSTRVPLGAIVWVQN